MTEEKGARCVWCDAYFTWTHSGPNGPVKLYCTPKHSEKARAANKKFMSHFPPGVCPTPRKKCHRTAQEASAVVYRMTINNGSAPYLCNCGFYHLGRPKRGGWVPQAEWDAVRSDG